MALNTGTAEKWNRGVFYALRTSMHFIAAFHFWYGIYYDWQFVHFPNTHRMGATFGGKFKYLTFLDMIIQAVYFTICILNDVFGSNEVNPKKLPTIRKFKDYIMAAFAFPLALNVGISFWTLWHIDRELVLPKVLDSILPSWLNHVMHTNIMIFIVLDMFTTFRQYPSRKLCLTSLSIFMASYLAWLHVVKYFSGVWVYPVLDVLELPQRIAFFAVNLLVGVSLYFVGELLNNQIWSDELRQIKSQPKSKKNK